MLSQMPRVMLKRNSPPVGAKGNGVKHLKMSLREILPPLRFVRMTQLRINLPSWTTAMLSPLFKIIVCRDDREQLRPMCLGGSLLETMVLVFFVR